MGGIVEAVKTWLFTKAAKKAAITVAQAAGSYMLAHAGLVEKAGVSVSIDPDVLSGFMLAGCEIARNWLKFKFPKACGWL